MLPAMLNPLTTFTKPSIFGTPSVAIATLEAVDGKGLPITDERRMYLQCQFNPTELKIVKSVKWKAPEQYPPARNAPDLAFAGGEPATFSLNLVFDTTQATTIQGRDVRKHTNQLLKLVKVMGNDITRRKPPPRVQFQWGKITLFMAVLQKVEISYVLFEADGTPVRAKVSAEFIQQDDSDDPASPQNPTTLSEPRRTHRVREGERLDLIAYEEYGQSSQWRYLADANGLLDAADLRPGQVLIIPPLP